MPSAGMALDKVAFVTGAGSGIGRATAQLFAAEEARIVVVADIDRTSAAETARLIEASGGAAQPVQIDVAEPGAARAVVDDVVDAHGSLDCAVNCAGLRGLSAPVADYPIDAWRRVMAVNLDGVFLCMQAEIAAMLEIGGGAIVNIASGSGRRPPRRAQRLRRLQGRSRAPDPHGRGGVRQIRHTHQRDPAWPDPHRDAGGVLPAHPGSRGRGFGLLAHAKAGRSLRDSRGDRVALLGPGVVCRGRGPPGRRRSARRETRVTRRCARLRAPRPLVPSSDSRPARGASAKTAAEQDTIVIYVYQFWEPM